MQIRGMRLKGFCVRTFVYKMAAIVRGLSKLFFRRRVVNDIDDFVKDIDLFLYINLKERGDRKKEIENVLFNELNLPKNQVQRIEAVASVPGYTGCTKSHLLALERAIESKCNYVCILEDDFMLTVSPEAFYQRVNEAWQRTKGDFDVIFLAMTGIRLEPIKEMKDFHRVRAALAMPAFVVHSRYFEKLKTIYQLALQERTPHDLVTQRYQPIHQWYGFFPPIGKQRPGFSDIENRVVDYGYLEVDGRMIQKV